MWKQINKMWLNFGLPVLLFAIIVRCSELELSREAAFQGEFHPNYFLLFLCLFVFLP